MVGQSQGLNGADLCYIGVRVESGLGWGRVRVRMGSVQGYIGVRVGSG